jgi:hypothetical protein
MQTLNCQLIFNVPTYLQKTEIKKNYNSMQNSRNICVLPYGAYRNKIEERDYGELNKVKVINFLLFSDIYFLFFRQKQC